MSTISKGVLCKLSDEDCYGTLRKQICEYHRSIPDTKYEEAEHSLLRRNQDEEG